MSVVERLRSSTACMEKSQTQTCCFIIEFTISILIDCHSLKTDDTRYQNCFLRDMASQSDDAQKHSTLHLFIHDQGGNAPERNRGTAAIELDSTATTQV